MSPRAWESLPGSSRTCLRGRPEAQRGVVLRGIVPAADTSLFGSAAHSVLTSSSCNQGRSCCGKSSLLNTGWAHSGNSSPWWKLVLTDFLKALLRCSPPAEANSNPKCPVPAPMDGSACQFCTRWSHWLPEIPLQLCFRVGEVFCDSYNCLSFPFFKKKILIVSI